jgi:hypothetical protein
VVWTFTFLTVTGGAEAKTGTAVLIVTGGAILTGGAGAVLISDETYTEGS